MIHDLVSFGNSNLFPSWVYLFWLLSVHFYWYYFTIDKNHILNSILNPNYNPYWSTIWTITTSTHNMVSLAFSQGWQMSCKHPSWHVIRSVGPANDWLPLERDSDTSMGGQPWPYCRTQFCQTAGTCVTLFTCQLERRRIYCLWLCYKKRVEDY